MGAGTYDQLRNSHKGWVIDYLDEGEKTREEEWTRSIAVGSHPFVEKVKDLLGLRAKGKDVTEGTKGFQLRESPLFAHLLVETNVNIKDATPIHYMFYDSNELF